MSDITLEILRDGREPRAFDIVPGVYTVGSDDDCKICLAHTDVAGRHAILTVGAEGSWVEDLGSSYGTYIDERKISGRGDVPMGTPFRLGPFTLLLSLPSEVSEDHADTSAVSPPEEDPSTSSQRSGDHAVGPAKADPTTQPSTAPPEPSEERVSPALEHRRSIKRQIHLELMERLDIKRMAASHIAKEELSTKAQSTLQQIVRDVADKLPPGTDAALLAQEVYDEALGLGPLELLLADESVTEIMVNGPDQIYVERAGKLVLTDSIFMDEESVLAVIERIVSPIGRRIDESQPYVDARLSDGSRVNAIIHPLSLIGPCLTIRKFSKDPFTDEDLINFGTFTRGCADFLKTVVQMRKNIIVSGGTGSGKTSFLNVLSSYIPSDDRIVTIEDAAELRLTQRHVVRLESRPPNIEGRGAVTIRNLVSNALRMRPDRIVVGECRGGEALDMLQAMNTGHDGSLTTVHANSPRDAVSRLETLVLMAGMDLPVRAIREQISSAVDMIVQEQRFSDGSRKIVKVTELVGQEGDQILMQDIFEYRQSGVSEDGKVHGEFVATGAVPTFLDDLEMRGITVDRTMFTPPMNDAR
jgi:pilus assembly protein CpaF